MNTKTYHKIQSVILLLFICLNTSQGRFPAPTYAPVERLLTNAAAYTRENPNNANGYYILGRLNYMAFASKTSIIMETWPGKDTALDIDPYWENTSSFDSRILRAQAEILVLKELGYESISDYPQRERSKLNELIKEKQTELQKQNWKLPILNQNELIQYARQAIINFKKAIELDNKNGLYYLGLASLLEQYVEYLKKIDLKEVPEEFRNIILSQARDYYYDAYELSIKQDLLIDGKPVTGLKSLVGYEAGNNYIRLAESDKLGSEDDKIRITDVKKRIKQLDSLTKERVTPIIFTLERIISPADLLERNLQIKFDLDGDGATELWPWMKTTTGILVWDEDGKGEITSGRQMFGSVTWWLFFNDGYHALDSLDDNRDGRLSGTELKGIAVWFDTNSNGKSEQGEIKTLDELGIISISTKSTSIENGWPANRKGIKLKTGRTIPTYDWIASPMF